MILHVYAYMSIIYAHIYVGRHVFVYRQTWMGLYYAHMHVSIKVYSVYRQTFKSLYVYAYLSI